MLFDPLSANILSNKTRTPVRIITRLHIYINEMIGFASNGRSALNLQCCPESLPHSADKLILGKLIGINSNTSRSNAQMNAVASVNWTGGLNVKSLKSILKCLCYIISSTRLRTFLESLYYFTCMPPYTTRFRLHDKFLRVYTRQEWYAASEIDYGLVGWLNFVNFHDVILCDWKYSVHN